MTPLSQFVFPFRNWLTDHTFPYPISTFQTSSFPLSTLPPSLMFYFPNVLSDTSPVLEKTVFIPRKIWINLILSRNVLPRSGYIWYKGFCLDPLQEQGGLGPQFLVEVKTFFLKTRNYFAFSLKKISPNSDFNKLWQIKNWDLKLQLYTAALLGQILLLSPKKLNLFLYIRCTSFQSKSVPEVHFILILNTQL